MTTGWVAGVDGCSNGWVVVLRNLGSGAICRLGCKTFSAVLALPEQPSVIGVDVPIGLLDQGQPGGRLCERAARALLGKQGVRVFSAPTAPALAAYIRGGNHATVSAANRASSLAQVGLSIQTFSIMNKIAEVDLVMTPALQKTVFELHPEVSFRRANGGTPIPQSKRRVVGRATRASLLAGLGFPSTQLLALPRPLDSKADDVLDAAVACWTAMLIEAGTATPLPTPPPVGGRGLSMAIWQ